METIKFPLINFDTFVQSDSVVNFELSAETENPQRQKKNQICKNEIK